MKRWINNLRFRSKLVWIFGIMFFLTTSLSGMAYYNYASRDIEANFQVGAEDVLEQIVDTLSLRLEVINQRAKGMLTNFTFGGALSDYLNNPTDINIVRTMGTVSDFLKDLEMGESLIHSTFICTDKGNFENFVRIRQWDFDFKESDYYKVYEEQPGKAIRWFSAREDELFQDTDMVITCVWQFSVQSYAGKEYLIIQLKQSELEKILKRKYEFFDKILILDEDGKRITGSEGLDSGELMELTHNYGGGNNIITSDYEHEGESYLVTCGKVGISGWRVYGLKSRQSLLGSLGSLKNVIVEIMGVVFLIGVAAILLLSHQLTEPLTRLEKRMSCVQRGDFNTRFFYPYKSEIGSLAKSFNYMIEEIQALVRKQEETIEELKQQRDYAAEVQKQKRKAELKALQAQINPHFLYNTLNAITWQAADQGAEEISILSNSLGKFFRISLSRGAEVIPLKDELEHAASYLEIQSIRYHSRISYTIEVDRRWTDYRIIKLVLQPLVENSIYHGIKEKAGPGHIRIFASVPEEAGRQLLHLNVWDDGMGIETDKLKGINESLRRGDIGSGEGYGIFNVNERIQLFYGTEYGLQYESVHGQWTRAVLTLPMQDMEVKSCTGY